MENIEKTEKGGMTLKDVFYLLKKYIILEIAIVLAALLAGGALCLFRPTVYVASAQVDVIAKTNESDGNEYTQITYAARLVPDICIVMKTPTVVNMANGIYVHQNETDVILANNITTSYDENSSIITVTYRDGNPNRAKDKLRMVLSATNSYYAEKDNMYVVLNSLYGEEPSVGAVNNTVKTMAVAGIAGVALAAIIAFVLYFIGDKISSVERVEGITGKKNITSVQLIKSKNKKQATNELVSMDLDKLADSLVFLHSGDDEKVYQIQSSVHGEGKSSVTANLAIALGKIQKKTLIIECDFHRPTIYRYFKQKRHVGLTDYFKDFLPFEGIIKNTPHENVDIITCGERIENHTLLFMSGKFETLINKAKEKYDFVLLDCAPAGQTSDFISISRHVDSTLLVVGCEKVSSQYLKTVVNELDSCNANVIGTVFNFSGKLKGNNAYYYYKAYEPIDENEESAGDK